MVFENLTLFEIQLDGAQIGPRTMSTDEPTDEIEHAESNGGPGRLFGLLAFALVMTAAGLYYRRTRSADVDLDADADADESDLVEAQ